MIKIKVTDQNKIRAMTYALSMGLNDLVKMRDSVIRQDPTARVTMQKSIESFKTAIVDLSAMIDGS